MSMTLDRTTLQEIRDAAFPPPLQREYFAVAFEELAKAADRLDAMIARQDADSQPKQKPQQNTEFLSVCPNCLASIVIHATLKE